LGVDRQIERSGYRSDERQGPLVLQHLLEEVAHFALLEGFQIFKPVMDIETLLEDGQAIVLPAQLLQAAGREAQAFSRLLGS
jgi:hypothetical protein